MTSQRAKNGRRSALRSNRLPTNVLSFYYKMRLQTIFIFACGSLAAQETQTNEEAKQGTATVAEVPQFQAGATLNDERVKVFVEFETKAKTGDASALLTLGDYYMYKQFPVNKNEAKAEEYWTKGASLGSDDCASRMYLHFNKGTESESVIEKTKWAAIRHQLMKIKHGMPRNEFKRPDNVSESSFNEATKRAEAFIAGAKLIPASIAPPVATKAKRAAALKFGSIQLFDEYRRKICAEYMKAALPIYNKGDSASDSEKQEFTLAAIELVRLQSYVGKKDPITLSSNSNNALREINNRKIEDLYARMSAAQIKTSSPVTRTELNEASKYINALGQLMQLPVTLNTY